MELAIAAFRARLINSQPRKKAMNYYSDSGRFYSPRPNRTGAIYDALAVSVFMFLLVFGIVSTYGLG
jgi:hypothetical protein